jgi:hypothetical protein
MIRLHSALLLLNPIGACKYMAKVKELVIEVMELYDKDYTLSKIALVTELSVDEVDQILTDYHEYYVPIY